MTVPNENKKAALLRATLELISEQGFHGTPMSQIAERAGIGVGTIYRYYENKEALINALYIDLKQRIAGYVLHDADGLPVREALLCLMRNTIHYCVQHPAELSFAEQYENSPLITAATREESARASAEVEQLFRRARQENLLKMMPFEVLGAIVSGSTIALAKLYLSDALPPDDTVLDAALEAIWDAISQ